MNRIDTIRNAIKWAKQNPQAFADYLKSKGKLPDQQTAQASPDDQTPPPAPQSETPPQAN